MPSTTSTDHAAIAKLEPTSLWEAFLGLNAIPRASKQEARISAYVVSLGNGMGLDTVSDRLGNVLIKKPASPGYESHPTVVLQSHIDMVWQKNSDSDFDFESEGIQMEIDGDWVRAKGTTLGADNGIGAATILSILQSKDLVHPPLECLFTTDEETGMSGAKALDPGWLQGRVLLNLDTEQDNELTIGCAGGADVTAKATYIPEAPPSDHAAWTIEIRGLKGGHSGMEIHLGRANANKVMNRLLLDATRRFEIRLASLEGGSLRNAIPRESTATVLVPRKNMEAFGVWLLKESLVIRHENEVTDPSMNIVCKPCENQVDQVVPAPFARSLYAAIAGTLSGIDRMSPSIEGLVQTSNNLARVEVENGKVAVLCLARSSVDTERDALTQNLIAILSTLGGTVETGGEYPGWQPDPHSKIVEIMRTLYCKLHSDEPHVAACHAGLECGIIGAKFPGMEMISFGPNILGAHSPEERVQVSSVQKFFDFLLATLQRL